MNRLMEIFGGGSALTIDESGLGDPIVDYALLEEGRADAWIAHGEYNHFSGVRTPLFDRKVQLAWIIDEAEDSTIHAWNFNFRDEQAFLTHVASRIAENLINTDGTLNLKEIKGFVDALKEKNWAYRMNPTKGYLFEMRRALKQLLVCKEIHAILESYGDPCMRAKDFFKVNTANEAKIAAIAAYLARLRQFDVRSCFGTAPAIAIKRYCPEVFFLDIRTLMATGYMYGEYGKKRYCTPFNPTRHSEILNEKIHITGFKLPSHVRIKTGGFEGELSIEEFFLLAPIKAAAQATEFSRDSMVSSLVIASQQGLLKDPITIKTFLRYISMFNLPSQELAITGFLGSYNNKLLRTWEYMLCSMEGFHNGRGSWYMNLFITNILGSIKLSLLKSDEVGQIDRYLEKHVHFIFFAGHDSSVEGMWRLVYEDYLGDIHTEVDSDSVFKDIKSALGIVVQVDTSVPKPKKLLSNISYEGTYLGGHTYCLLSSYIGSNSYRRIDITDLNVFEFVGDLVEKRTEDGSKSITLIGVKKHAFSVTPEIDKFLVKVSHQYGGVKAYLEEYVMGRGEVLPIADLNYVDDQGRDVHLVLAYDQDVKQYQFCKAVRNAKGCYALYEEYLDLETMIHVNIADLVVGRRHANQLND